MAPTPLMALPDGTLVSGAPPGFDDEEAPSPLRSVSFSAPTQVRAHAGGGGLARQEEQRAIELDNITPCPPPRRLLQSSIARLMTGVAEHDAAVEARASGGRAGWQRRRSINGDHEGVPEPLRDEALEDEEGWGAGGEPRGRSPGPRRSISGGARCV